MKKRSRARRILLTLLILFLIIILLLSIGAVSYIKRVTDEELDLSLFTIDEAHSVTKIYTMVDGEWVEWREERILGEHNFEFVSIENVPKNLINAFVAIEDKRFFEHSGVDWYRTLGAAANYVLNFDSRFGASTITQQLIKNVTGEDDISIERKIREISWALELEKELSKDEILELYLNIINLADNCYGVGSASQRYFFKICFRAYFD